MTKSEIWGLITVLTTFYFFVGIAVVGYMIHTGNPVHSVLAIVGYSVNLIVLAYARKQW